MTGQAGPRTPPPRTEKERTYLIRDRPFDERPRRDQARPITPSGVPSSLRQMRLSSVMQLTAVGMGLPR